jgi:hypothetical protein
MSAADNRNVTCKIARNFIKTPGTLPLIRSVSSGGRQSSSPHHIGYSTEKGTIVRDVAYAVYASNDPYHSASVPQRNDLHATVQGMKLGKRRRVGATETVGVSLDPGTKPSLKKLAVQKHQGAVQKHQGNVSALIAEMTEDAIRQVAFEKAWAWYSGPEPD